MNESTIIKLIRRGIGEPKPREIGDSDITEIILEFVKVLGMKIKERDPSYYRTRTLLISNTHIFTRPADCMTISKVWDLGTNAKDITDATNATPIVVTCAGHGYADDQVKTIQDVGGNTVANGTWKIDNATTDTFELVGSAGSGVYTSGGKVWDDSESLDERLMTKIGLPDATNDNDSHWYPRDRNIVVDDPEFTNDLLLAYEKTPSAITDIPEEYHYGGLVSGVIVALIKLPKPEAPSYEKLMKSLDFHQGNWRLINSQIDRTFKLARARIAHKTISTF